MNKITLIIQRTLNGLDIDYRSQSINESELEAKGILYDERNEINQLDCEVVLSITNTAEFKVYSYINNRMLDVSKRKGFYAVRLMGPRNVRIPNVLQVLQAIAQRYDEHLDNNTINNLNYTDILDEVNSTIQPAVKLLSPAIHKTVSYVFMDYTNESDNALNNSKLELFHKTYLLDHRDRNTEASLNSVGMKDFKAMASVVRSIVVDNTHHLLNGIWADDVRLDFSKIASPQFELICLNTDRIFYTSALHNKKIIITGSQLTLQRPQPVQQSRRTSSRSGLSAGYWIALIAVLSVGAAGGYFASQYIDSSKYSATDEISNVGGKEDDITFNLKINNANSKAFLLDTETSELSKYYFKYDPQGPEWKFRDKNKGSSEDQVLTQATLKSMLNNDTAKIALLIKELKRYADISIKDSIESKMTNPSKAEQNGASVPITSNKVQVNTKSPVEVSKKSNSTPTGADGSKQEVGQTDPNVK